MVTNPQSTTVTKVDVVIIYFEKLAILETASYSLIGLLLRQPPPPLLHDEKTAR